MTMRYWSRTIRYRPNYVASFPSSWTASIFRMIQGCGHIEVMSPDTVKHLVQIESLRRLYPGTNKEGFDSMTGHRPFKELTKGFSEARKARVVGRLLELKTERALNELREQSQEDLAREHKFAKPAQRHKPE